ncbi:hypothetical protein CHARACLAT_017689 [Characodon lateralis]|uniref:Uncharacterized protein n=1 Tax=Characodon lateralis TaxID=208331 RepID=A0ABU7EAS0_9TELE|nr:hypothetical protein [Characodon lateralis]
MMVLLLVFYQPTSFGQFLTECLVKTSSFVQEYYRTSTVVIGVYEHTHVLSKYCVTVQILCIAHTHSASFMYPDSICSLVVLHLQRGGVPGYSLFYTEEEVQSSQLSPRLPSLYHVHPLVDRYQVGPRWTVVFRSDHQLFHPRAHVRLLWHGRLGTSYAEVPLVEEVPHHNSDGG